MIQIKHKRTDKVLFEHEGPTLKDAVVAAAKAEIGLVGADLVGAYLVGADLVGAYLGGADLGGAYLGGADLGGAYLGGADLGGAYLGGADLAEVDLSRCNGLARVRRLDEALNYDPAYRDKRTPRERKAAAAALVKAWVPLSPAERAAKYRARNPDVPVVPDLDAKILEVLEAGHGLLEMGSWHGSEETRPGCGMTHCRGGWAVHLAGDAGYALEAKYGGSTEMAAQAIYRASTGRVPYFYASNEDAMADIRRCATEGTAGAET